jgi:hypothetical protein
MEGTQGLFDELFIERNTLQLKFGLLGCISGHPLPHEAQPESRIHAFFLQRHLNVHHPTQTSYE